MHSLSFFCQKPGSFSMRQRWTANLCSGSSRRACISHKDHSAFHYCLLVPESCKIINCKVSYREIIHKILSFISCTTSWVTSVITILCTVVCGLSSLLYWATPIKILWTVLKLLGQCEIWFIVCLHSSQVNDFRFKLNSYNCSRLIHNKLGKNRHFYKDRYSGFKSWTPQSVLR